MSIDVTMTENLGDASRMLSETMRERMLEAAILVRNNTVEALSGSRSGRVYRVPGTSVTYVASAPGEPPAVQLGDLRKSVKFGVEVEDGSVVGFVGSELDKAPMLEYGTRNMAARPWLRPSFEGSLDAVRDIFGRRWF